MAAVEFVTCRFGRNGGRVGRRPIRAGPLVVGTAHKDRHPLPKPGLDGRLPRDAAEDVEVEGRRSSKNALEMVCAARTTLRKSDARVADLVLADPFRILETSVGEAARLAGVSQPTVMRFCVAVGFSGYQEFNLRLAQSLALDRAATHSVISDKDTLGGVADKVFEYTLTNPDWAR